MAFYSLWVVPEDGYAYVEPTVTDPDFGRMGLGKVALWEGIRHCAVEGATVTYAGSGQAFYRSMGFEKIYGSRGWIKLF